MRNLEYQTNRRCHKYHARAAITDKWQRDALQRQDTDHGSDVDERLDTEPGQYADGNEQLEIIGCPLCSGFNTREQRRQKG